MNHDYLLWHVETGNGIECMNAIQIRRKILSHELCINHRVARSATTLVWEPLSQVPELVPERLLNLPEVQA